MEDIYKNISLIDLEGEIWVSVREYPNYMVSNIGRVKKLQTTVFRKSNLREPHLVTKKEFISEQKPNYKGYLKVSMDDGIKRKMASAHRLVALAFIPNPENKKEVNHINGIKSNNRVENLEWMTCKENIRHAFKHKLRLPPALGKFGKDNSHSIPIYQLNMDGSFVKEWYSARDAARELKISPSGIGHACRGDKPQASGFKWSFKMDMPVI